MNHLKLYNVPNENVFEERRKQIKNVENVVRRILNETGYTLIKNGKYESGDPTLQTLYRGLKAENINPEEKKKVEIKLPICEDGSYLINGNHYVPVFQISDVPIFKRAGEFLTVHNTFCTLILNSQITCVKISHTEWPLLLLFLRVCEEDQYYSKFDFVKHNDTCEGDVVRIRIAKDIDLKLKKKTYGELLEPFTEEMLKQLNELQSVFETKEEGIQNILHSWKPSGKIDKVLNVINLVDFMMVPNGVFDDPFTMVDLLLHVVKNRDVYKNWDIREINDISKRRVRLSEWICYKLAQQYKINGTKKSRGVYADAIINVLNLDQRRILDDTVNPLGELCIQSRVIYDGPGGIAKDACSVLVRNLHESYKGVIDPIDTPTGEAVGICQHMVPDAKVERGILIPSKSGSILSTAAQLVPLLQHDDTIRIEMACNQMRQSIALAEPEIPLVKSGKEYFYTGYTSSLKLAKNDGQVIYKDSELLVVKYDTGNSGEVIDLSPKSFTDFDKTLITSLNVGDKFKCEDTLAHTKSIDPETHELMLGKNMLVGFMSLDSWNFEDAIVVSESAAKKMRYKCTIKNKIDLNERALFSLDPEKYVPLFPNGTYVHEGEPIMRLGAIDVESLEGITPLVKDVLAPIDGIFSYKYYIKSELSNHMQMQKWNKEKRLEQQRKEEKLKGIFSYFEDEQKYVEKYCYLHNFKKIHDDLGVIEYTIQGEKPLHLGCKLSNRHGNKGTISIIMPDEKMPRLSDGRHLDVVLNPLGIITRMNVGQLYELHLSWFADQFVNANKHLSDSEFKEKILEFVKIIDNTEECDTDNGIKSHMYSHFAKELLNKTPEVLNEIRNKGLQIIQPPFQSCTAIQLEELRKFCNCDYECDVNYEGKTYKCSVGWMYMMRLHHEPDHKIFGRSLGVYGKHEQPPSGADAHRLGEMEVWALLAYGASDTLKEFMSIKSDNPSERRRLFEYLYNNESEMYVPENLDTITKETFKTYLRGCGLEIEF